MARKHARERGTTRRGAAAVTALTDPQHGVVTSAQLRELGVSAERLRAWVRVGWLIRLHRGVYAIRGITTWRTRWQAAVFACGDGAALSHHSAAALWRIRKPREGPIEVTVAGYGGKSQRSGIVVHRSATFTDGDVRTRDAIAVTSPARTIVDLAGAGIERRDLERTVDEADRRRLCRAADLQREIQRHRRPGCAEVRVLLADHDIGSTLTRSALEERFLALCRGGDLPEPLVNARLLGLTVDFLWPQQALVVEVDGRSSHDTRRGFQDDRDRDSLLTTSGYRVLRFTWWDVMKRPSVVLQRVGSVLRQRP